MNKEKIIDLLERRLLFLTRITSDCCSHEDFLMSMGAMEEVEKILDIMKGEMYNE